MHATNVPVSHSTPVDQKSIPTRLTIMNKPQIMNLLKLIRAANRKDQTSSIALKSALLGLLVGVNWLEEAAAAELTAAQIVERIGASLTAAQKAELVQEINAVIQASQSAGFAANSLTQEQLAKELAVLAKASGVSQEELMNMLQTAGMSKSGLAALQPAIVAAYNEPANSSEDDDEVAAALASNQGEGVLPLAGVGLGPLLGLGAGVVALAAAGGSDGSAPVTVVTGSDGPLSNAVIRNTDGTLLGTTDSTGNLAVPSALLTPGTVLTLTTVPGSTVDLSTGNPVRFEVTFKGQVPASGPVIISPISTLIVDGVSVDSLNLALGLPVGFSLASFNSSTTLAINAQNLDAASVTSFSSGLLDLIEHASKEAGFELPAGVSITTALADALNDLLGGGFTSAAGSQSAGLIQELTIKFLTDNGVDNPGHVQSIADQIAQGVATVESALSDGYSASPDQPVLAQVDTENAGMNTAAELVAVSNPAGIIESASTGPQAINVSGSLTVEDNDAGDSIVGSVVGNAQIVYSAGSLPAGVDISALGLASALVFSPAIANTNDQSLSYVYNPSATDFSFLAEGQSLTITYQVQVTDDQFQSGSKPLVITITGTNNAPVVVTATGQDVGAVSEAGNIDNGAVVASVATASGQLTASDVDAMASQNWSVVGVPSATYGSFSLTPTGAWTYSLDNSLAATQALREGQTVVETFNVLVTDNLGATASETVTIVVLGTNDSPLVTTAVGAKQASLVEDGNLDDGTVVGNVATASGQLTASDVDAMASQSWSLVDSPSSTSATSA
jgi:VCBS repeat-containing protein